MRCQLIVFAAMTAFFNAGMAEDASTHCPPTSQPITAQQVLRELRISPDALDIMLYRFEGEPGEGYLFGTVHLGPPYISRPPPQALLAIRQASIFATEVIMDSRAHQFFRNKATAGGGDDTGVSPQQIGPNLYNRYLTAARRRGIDPQTARSLTPWAAFLSIGRPAIAPGSSLDEQLQGIAERMQRQIVGLQPIDDFVQSIESITRMDQLAILKDTICQQDTLPQYYKQLLLVYSSGVPEAVVAFSHAGRDGDPLFTRLDELMVNQRNALFINRLLALLEQGSVFLAVGAQHLAGANGLLSRLRALGFTVRRAP